VWAIHGKLETAARLSSQQVKLFNFLALEVNGLTSGWVDSEVGSEWVDSELVNKRNMH
jgi:hypothetical protein